jgi:hypothetical protein
LVRRWVSTLVTRVWLPQGSNQDAPVDSDEFADEALDAPVGRRRRHQRGDAVPDGRHRLACCRVLAAGLNQLSRRRCRRPPVEEGKWVGRDQDSQMRDLRQRRPRVQVVTRDRQVRKAKRRRRRE